MYIKGLLNEKDVLMRIQKHHIDMLTAQNNPVGILVCHKHGKNYRWQRRNLMNGRTVKQELRKTEHSLAQKLAVNLYRSVCIQYIQKQLNMIDDMIRNNYPDHQIKTTPEEDVEAAVPSVSYEDLPISRLLRKVRNVPREPAGFFTPGSPYRAFILSHLLNEYKWVIDWYLRDFPQKKDRQEDLQFPVTLGYKVRSKSEVISANRLYEEGILFHFEELLIVNGNSYHPDFCIAFSPQEIYIWEHNGAMDKDNYATSTKNRISDYIHDGWLPGINMISTYETKYHPLTEDEVDHQIHWLKTRHRLAFPDLPPDESFNMYELAAYAECQNAGV